MATERIIDDTDALILNILQENARESQAEIARSVGLAPSAVLERLRKLEARGIVQGYSARVNPTALDRGMLAFIAVRSSEGPADDSISRQLAILPEVLEVHHVAGDDCHLIKVRTRDAEQLSLLLRTRIGRIPGVRSTRTTIVLETVKESSKLPIPTAAEVMS